MTANARGLSAVLATVAVASVAAGGVVASAAGRGAAPAPGVGAAEQQLPGTHCPAFPADNVWNTPVTGLPVDAHSAQWLAHMDAGSAFLHPDFGPSGGSSPYGIPWQITLGPPALRARPLPVRRSRAILAPTRCRPTRRSREDLTAAVTGMP